MEWAN